MDKRYQDLHNWLTITLGTQVNCSPLASDASVRRYFRLLYQDQSYIAVDSPPRKIHNHNFIAVGKTLETATVSVPSVLQADLEQGFLLLTDLGDRLLLDYINNNTANPLYQQAFETLTKIQRCPRSQTSSLPTVDHQLLYNGLLTFNEWFLQKYLTISVSAVEKQLLAKVYELLIQNAMEQPQRFSHRDYHSRNLMLSTTNQLSVIDYQDASWGAITYDLVSLLKDCYIAWPRTQVLDWVNHYRLLAIDTNIIDHYSNEQFIHWFDWMGIQRHLRVLGVFTRLHLRDNKSNYLQHLPRILNYLLEATASYPELRDLNTFLQQQIILKLEKQQCNTP